jgi:hypothetical protein
VREEEEEEEEEVEEEEGVSVGAPIDGWTGTEGAILSSHAFSTSLTPSLLFFKSWESMRNIPQALDSSRRFHDVLEEDKEKSEFLLDFDTISFCK